MAIPPATANETDVNVLRERVNYLRGDNESLRARIAALEQERSHLQSLTAVNENLPVPALRRQISDLERQRDELLAALESAVEAIRLFRNEPALEKLIQLRATAGYVAMDAAMDKGNAAIAKVQP